MVALRPGRLIEAGPENTRTGASDYSSLAPIRAAAPSPMLKIGKIDGEIPHNLTQTPQKAIFPAGAKQRWSPFSPFYNP